MHKRILVISPEPTHPPTAGNRSSMLAYIEMLEEEGYSFNFLWIANINSTKDELKSMQEYWGDNLFYFQKNQIHRIVEAFLRLIHFKRTGNYKVDDFYPYGIKRMISKIKKNVKIDAVMLNYIFLTKLSRYFKGYKKVLYTHDVFTNKHLLTGSKWFSVSPNDELKAINRVDNIIAVQEVEANYYSFLTQNKVVTSYCYSAIKNTPFTKNKNLLYLAGPNEYNIESILWFVKNVFPIIAKKYNDAKLVIGGRICSSIEKVFEDTNIIRYGKVDDLFEFYNQGNIFINPTFNGTGIKVKAFESLAFGKVLVSHPHNTIGIYKKEQAPVLVASNPDEYVKHIESLLDSEQNVIELKRKSIQYIEELNEIVKSRFIDAIEN